MARARAGRLSVHGRRLTWPVLDGLTLASMYSPRSWPQFALALQQVWQALPTAATAVTELEATFPPTPAYDNSVDSFAAVACSDSVNPADVFAWPRAAAAADRSAPYFGDIWTYSSAVCATWPTRAPQRYSGPWTARTARPVLVIGNRYDPATRYAGAQRAARLLPGARLLTLDGYGHTALGQSSCIDRFRDAYLVSGSLPAPGTVCEPDLGPFQSAPTRALTSAAAVVAATLPAVLRPVADSPGR